MSIDREAFRPAFEAWWAKSGRDPEWLKTRRPNGDYGMSGADDRFECWCAATERLLSDEAVERAARSICHYSGGPSDFNSCCQHENRCQVDARKAIIASIGNEG